ncbi:hypothetical protein [Helicobacter brantae]|uniref:LPS export ABC transporter periplasmic protein LptC n=1 Tax=Helicobacter brantae TaxID=375927 RepID=A0A3D8J5L4_9HELI|nr:hypothetical protein [Helicobacter brantae]RDU72184.1 hypothetical protein CQA58_00855 [Helicobacter brantae]
MSSSLKTYLFFLCILFFSVYFVVQPPEGGEKKERSNEEVATLEINQFTLYSIRESKPELLVVGLKALRYDDREEFFDFFLANFGLQREKKKDFKQEDIEYFKVGHAIKKKDMYWFYKGIDYLSEGGMSFVAKEGIYNSSAKIFDSIGYFQFQSQEGNFEGENLHFDGEKQVLDANNPKGKIWLENSL